MDVDRVIERTLRYLQVPAVVGFEQPFVEHLERELLSMGRATERSDDLLAAPGDPVSIVSAHIDRHGLVTGHSGRLHYAARLAAGEHRPLTNRLRMAICSRFQREEVVAYEAASGSVVGRGTVQHNDHCGIGPELDLEVEGLEGVAPGTPVAFAHAHSRNGSWLRGQLDNALSAAIAIELIHIGFPGTVLLTCGEEAGRSWQGLRDWLEAPTTQILVLDTSPFDEREAAERGVVVQRHADAGATFDVRFTSLLALAARRAGVSTIWKDEVLTASRRPLGRTELGRLVAATEGRLTGTTLQIPTTDYHSNHEATTRQAIAAALAVLTELYR